MLTRKQTLPDPLAAKLRAHTGAYFEPGISNPLISCSQSNNKSTINFGLGGHGGPVISVPIGELVTPISFVNGSQLRTKGGGAACQFGIWGPSKYELESTEGTYVVGSAFLQSAYVVSLFRKFDSLPVVMLMCGEWVYNLDDWSISLAQTKINSTESNIQEIKLNKTEG